MQFTYSEENSFQVIAIDGDIRVAGIISLKNEFQKLAAETCGIAVDLAGVRAVDSSGLSLFVNMYKRLQAQNRAFCLFNVPEKIRDLLAKVNFGKIITMYQTKDDFLAATMDIVKEDLFPPPTYDFEGLPYRTVQLKCPLCNAEDFPAFVVNKASQEIVFEKNFIAPGWQGRNGASPVDVIAMQIAICPDCYFAARHLVYFSDMDGGFTSILTEKERHTFIKDAAVRRKLIVNTPLNAKDKMAPPFTGPAAYFAYVLAEECAHSLYRLDNALAIYDLGYYNSILTRYGDDRTYVQFVRKTYMWFNEVHKHRAKFSSRIIMEAFYFLVVISKLLKKPKEAERYFAEMQSLKSSQPEFKTFLDAARAAMKEE
ncbi:MAG: hypothetical protein A2350_09570 [Candidatus Raymondbacteria bacterium RifOxyB12_full_50_8]|nr:MAG: hypothetical protein A2248_13715 [Candidatus Raymondbacteria bacterium RIFOXYA2_FULL_49_16]OGJ95182.1 MAG: hypothetical protein A2350_09570 [Candidatus Raymondbacteria bacterium RifOxyB12_full_50_8]OGP42336.1 MAG: hypothetical protein A2324_20180 [Candidatus Raymondbacteria bacterium RIFOXYB2_FULL_49_35]